MRRPLHKRAGRSLLAVPGADSKQRRHSLVMQSLPCSPQMKKSVFPSFLTPTNNNKRTQHRRGGRKRRCSVVGQVVQLSSPENMLSKFISTGQEDESKRNLFGHDTKDINSKELRSSYQRSKDEISAKRQHNDMSLFMVKTMGRRTRTLRPGDSMDSLALFSSEHKSASSVLTECECDLLYLRASDLNRVLQLHNRDRLRTKVLSLETIPMLAALAYSARLRLSNIAKIRALGDGDELPLYDADSGRALCYWILKGQCEVRTLGGKNRPGKVLVRREHGSLLHEYGLLQCHAEYYENIIASDNRAKLAALGKRVRVQCAGKCEFVRFYWDEFLRTLERVPRIKVLKLARNHCNQLLKYIDSKATDAKCRGLSKSASAALLRLPRESESEVTASAQPQMAVLPTPRTLGRLVTGKQGMRSVFVHCAESLVKPHNVQAHLNDTCLNQRNRRRKYQLLSRSRSTVLLRDRANGNLSVFF